VVKFALLTPLRPPYPEILDTLPNLTLLFENVKDTATSEEPYVSVIRSVSYAPSIHKTGSVFFLRDFLGQASTQKRLGTATMPEQMPLRTALHPIIEESV
jgi:hypothetical protein